MGAFIDYLSAMKLSCFGAHKKNLFFSIYTTRTLKGNL